MKIVMLMSQQDRPVVQTLKVSGRATRMYADVILEDTRQGKSPNLEVCFESCILYHAI
jgi:hypothetical protein